MACFPNRCMFQHHVPACIISNRFLTAQQKQTLDLHRLGNQVIPDTPRPIACGFDDSIVGNSGDFGLVLVWGGLSIFL